LHQFDTESRNGSKSGSDGIFSEDTEIGVLEQASVGQYALAGFTSFVDGAKSQESCPGALSGQ
jgi:hypothetical protein